MRKERYISIVDDGAEILFRIRQMPAVKQERWINKCVMLLLGGGSLNEISLDGLQKKFEEGDVVALLTIFGSLKYDDMEPLYDELLECCEHVPNPQDRKFSVPQTAETIGSVIGEVKNLYKLRIEAFKVNFDFFRDGEDSPNPKPADVTISKTT